MGYSPWGRKESGHAWVTGNIRNSQPLLGAVLSSGKERPVAWLHILTHLGQSYGLLFWV